MTRSGAIREKAILVTGATDGLGRATARVLAARGATVLLHGRDPSRLEDTSRAVHAATGNDRLRSYLGDFCSLEEVRRLAQEVSRRETHLDVLINNAGIGTGPRGAPREQSADGHELRFAVNYLAPFLLTHLLPPLLRRSGSTRIVNVASAPRSSLQISPKFNECTDA